MRQWQRNRFMDLPAGLLIVGIAGLMGCASLGGGGAYNTAWGPQQKCRAVHTWVVKFSSELPKPPLGTKSQFGYYKDLSINLYKDEYFTPVFGTRFDQISEKDRHLLGSEVEKCFVMSGYKDWQDLNPYYGTVMPHWQGDGPSFSRSARETKQWQERVLMELKSAPSIDETFGKYLKAKAEAKTAMERFLPAEQHLFNEALDREGSRVAEAALVARITKAGAAASTYEGLKELQHVIDDKVGLFSMVSPAVKAREEGRAAEAYRKGFTSVLEGDWKRFESRGAGIEGIKHGVQWYREFEDRYYGNFDIGPPVHEVLNRFREAREKDLAASGGKIIEILKAARTVEEMNGKQEEYLIAEIDQFGKGATPLYAWIGNQEATLNFAKEKWRFSANELALMKTPGIVTVPDSYGPPSGDDIHMALLRAYVSAGGRLVDKDTATVVTASFGDMLGTLGNGGLPRMSIGTAGVGSVSVEQCSERHVTPHVGIYGKSKGYVCRYIAKGQTTSDDFILTSQGWRSPSADDRVSERRNSATMKIITEIGSAVPKVGCVGRRGVLNWWCR